MMGKGGRKMERYTNALIFQPAGSPAVTANGSSATFDVSRFAEGVVIVNVTAVGGTSPTMALFIDTYDPVNNVWATLQQLTPQSQPINGTGAYAYPINNYGRMVRLRWQLGGTNPSFTFSAVFVSKS